MTTPLNQNYEEAVRLHGAGYLSEAAERYQQILREQPRHAGALHLLGVIAHQNGQNDVAVECISNAIRLDGRFADFHHNLGQALHAQGRYRDAASAYRQAIRLEPASRDSHLSLGLSLQAAGQFAEARLAVSEAIRLEPGRADAHNVLGNILRNLGQPDEAIASYQQALALEAQYPEALANLGAVLVDVGRSTEAIELLRFSLELNPSAAATHYNLGVALNAGRKFNEAIESLQRAQALGFDAAQTQHQLGIAQAGLRRLPQARAAFEEALRLRPDFVEVTNHLGMLWQEHGYLEEAIDCYRKVLAVRPDAEEVKNDLGCSLYELGRLDEAEACFREAIRQRPLYGAGHYNIGMIHLLKGEFEEGWAECEWRDRSEFEKKKSRAAVWDGSGLEGRSILLRPEQGLGDTIHFVRYARILAQSANSVFTEVQPPLVTLLRSSGIPNVISYGDDLPQVDVQIPLMSVPRYLKTRADTIPGEVPYLAAREDLVEAWRRRLSQFEGFRVGINWQGNPGYSFDALRSIPLVEFAALAAVPGVTLISLQQREGLDQLPQARERFTIHELGPDVDQEHGRFMDTMAIMRNLDLVITSDTVTAHLAGALGVPVWTALSRTPDWRWQLQREDCPWYPTMRLFRQTMLKDWKTVFARMAVALSEAAGRRQHLSNI